MATVRQCRPRAAAAVAAGAAYSTSSDPDSDSEVLGDGGGDGAHASARRVQLWQRARPGSGSREWVMRSRGKQTKHGADDDDGGGSDDGSSTDGTGGKHKARVSGGVRLSKKAKRITTLGAVVALVAGGAFVAWKWGGELKADVEDFVTFPEVKTQIVGAFSTATSAIVGAERTATSAVAGGFGDATKAIGGIFG
ncbi:hypothetical protein JCM3770_003820 [Rhodotorula araucariae]